MLFQRGKNVRVKILHFCPRTFSKVKTVPYRMLALLCALWFPTWESAKSDASSEFPMQKYPGMSVDPAMNVIINVSCVSPNPLHFALIASWLSMEAKIEKVLLATPARQKTIVPIPMYCEYRWHSRRQNLPPTQEGPSRNRRWAVDGGSWIFRWGSNPRSWLTANSFDQHTKLFVAKMNPT